MADDDHGKTDMKIAINTMETADNLRKMGYDEAGDVMEKEAGWAARQALQHGYVDEPKPPPEAMPGMQTTIGPYTGSGPGVPEPPEWPEYHEPGEPYEPPEAEPPMIMD
jgi:hypothetical protein